MSGSWLLRKAMSRTWLLRGAAVAVFAMLVGAWALGAADVGGGGSEPPEKATPASPEEIPETGLQRVAVPADAKPRRSRSAEPTPDALPDPSATPDGTTTPGEVAGTSATAPSKSPRPTSSKSPRQPRKPRSSNTPAPSPDSPTTEEPSDRCTDLGEVLNCVLAPITTRP